MNVLDFTDKELYLLHEGSHFHSYKLLGAHVLEQAGAKGVRFAVWAPHALRVSVVGNFNNWQGETHVMQPVGQSGVWMLFIAGIEPGEIYKYELYTTWGETILKADPYAFTAECPPATASVVGDLGGFGWNDEKWRRSKAESAVYTQPMLIYEVHLGSWRRGDGGKLLSYRELADQLVEYVAGMGYTHIELMPVAEHPFGGSWGYQATGYYAVTSRFGTPQDFMYFVDCCHSKGIGVILDWVPGHFCKDDHGLRCFDGTSLYEYGSSQKGENYAWGTANFDLGRPEVQSFLISNALFWFDIYHIDGIRVDAVSNMIYLDYGKEPHQWTQNNDGDNTNKEAIAFLRRLNETVFKYYPGALMMAEEATAWPMVTWPTEVGGLGFNFKWNMGWMNDMLRYMALDQEQRQHQHNLVTFSFMYAFSENFVLPLSHDEVVHGKKSLLDKMSGDYWQKFAGLRTLYGYWMAHPGKKLLFMGGEFGQFIEWQYDDSLDWHLLDYPMHKKLHDYVCNLNHIYLQERAFWEIDADWQGFEWIDGQDYSNSIICFLRKSLENDYVIVVCNFTPTFWDNYSIGVPQAGSYYELFNSDLEQYGGSGQKNELYVEAIEQPLHNRPYSVSLRIPPMSVIYLKNRPAAKAARKKLRAKKG